jgi:hypothetical protein
MQSKTELLFSGQQMNEIMVFYKLPNHIAGPIRTTVVHEQDMEVDRPDRIPAGMIWSITGTRSLFLGWEQTQ